MSIFPARTEFTYLTMLKAGLKKLNIKTAMVGSSLCRQMLQIRMQSKARPVSSIDVGRHAHRGLTRVSKIAEYAQDDIEESDCSASCILI